MIKLKLILADAEEEFIMRFSEYIRVAAYDEVIIAKSFTQFDKFHSFITNLDVKGAILLISDQWMQQLVTCNCSGNKQGDEYVCRVWAEHHRLTGELLKTIAIGAGTQLTRCHQIPFVNKYRPLHELLDDVRKLSNNHSYNEDEHVQPREKQVISFYSTTGGGGKTTAVFNAIKQMTAQNHSVLLISLEAVSALNLYIRHDEGADQEDFASLLYYLKMKDEDTIIQWLHQHMRYDSAQQIDYIAPPINYRNYADIEAEDISYLVNMLQRVKSYDAIMIDVDSMLSPATWGALEISDRIIWLVTDDVTCRYKTEQLMKELPGIINITLDQLKRKVVLTLNKYLGNIYNESFVEQFDIAHTLPYVPEWKAIDDIQQIYESDIYNSSMAELMARLQRLPDKLAV